MSRIYIAARMRARSRCREYRDELERAGHTVTSRWIDTPGAADANDIAQRDLHDLRAASVLLLVGHCGRNGGMATELGVSLERGMRILHVAAERGDNVFTAADGVEYHRTFHDALEALRHRATVAA